MTVEEVLCSLRVHESRLIEQENREEEQVLLIKASKLSKKSDRSQTSKGRGRFGQRARGRGCGRGRQQKEENEEIEKKPFDKSKIKCYNFQNMGHFADVMQDRVQNRSSTAKLGGG